MIKQASTLQLKRGEVSKKDGFIAITMRMYPRFIKKNQRDLFSSDLAPVRALLTDFRKYLKKTHSHDEAFKCSHYEERFTLSDEGLACLKDLAERSHFEDVYVICFCDVGERCHRELLMLMAQKWYGAKIGKVYNKYRNFEKRMPRLRKELLEREA